MLTYALRLNDRPDGLVSATFPDVPGAEAVGRDHDEAFERAKAALEFALDRYRREGRDFPPPRASGNLKITTVKFEMLVPA